MTTDQRSASVISEQLRHKHIRTLEVLQKLVSENQAMRKQLGLKCTDSLGDDTLPVAQSEVSLSLMDKKAMDRELLELKEQNVNLLRQVTSAQREIDELQKSNSSLSSSLASHKRLLSEAVATAAAEKVCAKCVALQEDIARLKISQEFDMSQLETALSAAKKEAESTARELAALRSQLQTSHSDSVEKQKVAELRYNQIQLQLAECKSSEQASRIKEKDALDRAEKARIVAESARARARQSEQERKMAETSLKTLRDEQKRLAAKRRQTIEPNTSTADSVSSSVLSKPHLTSSHSTNSLESVGNQQQEETHDGGFLPEIPSDKPQTETTQSPSPRAPPSLNMNRRHSTGSNTNVAMKQSSNNANNTPSSTAVWGGDPSHHDAFDALRRENDRLRMQLGERKQAQTILMRGSVASKQHQGVTPIKANFNSVNGQASWHGRVVRMT